MPILEIFIRPEHWTLAKQHAGPDVWERIEAAQYPPEPAPRTPGRCRLARCGAEIPPTGKRGAPKAFCRDEHDLEFWRGHEWQRRRVASGEVLIDVLNECLAPIIDQHAGPFRGWEYPATARQIARKSQPWEASPTEWQAADGVGSLHVPAAYLGIDPDECGGVLFWLPTFDVEVDVDDDDVDDDEPAAWPPPVSHLGHHDTWTLDEGEVAGYGRCDEHGWCRTPRRCAEKDEGTIWLRTHDPEGISDTDRSGQIGRLFSLERVEFQPIQRARKDAPVDWVEWYEQTNAEERAAALKKLLPKQFYRQKAKPETIEAAAREERYVSRNNTCTGCRMARPCECRAAA